MSERAQPAILVVDDEEVIRRLVCLVLGRAGYQVTAAENGRAAIRALCEERFDIVLTDVVMPDGDGIEVMMHARTTQPHARVIATTGGSRHLDAELCLRLAALGNEPPLPKPFTIDQLFAAIKRCPAAEPIAAAGSPA